MPYLIDSDVFIQAKNFHYGFDFCPAFWEWIVEANRKGVAFSIEKVGDELQSGADTLAGWAQKRGGGFFLPPEAEILASLGIVSRWVTSQGYPPASVNTFLQVADYYLVAHALAKSYIVVTHEAAAPPSSQKVKIPNVCIGVSVKCMTPFEMLRKERARFVLET